MGESHGSRGRPILLPTASPIVRVLNEEVRHYHRWCTPSILVDQERVEDFYASDVSISAGLLRHARRPHRRLRRGRALRRRGAGRRPHDVLRPRLERLELRRAADARARAPRRAGARRPQHATTRRSTRSRRSGWTSASCRRPTTPSSRPCCRPASTRCSAALARYPEALAVVYTSPTYEGLVRQHATRSPPRSTTPRPHAMRLRRRGLGRAPALPPELPPSAMDAGADVCRAVDPQAGGRPAADRADPLARRRGWTPS